MQSPPAHSKTPVLQPEVQQRGRNAPRMRGGLEGRSSRAEVGVDLAGSSCGRCRAALGHKCDDTDLLLGWHTHAHYMRMIVFQDCEQHC
jgi:hypothetical protein